MFKFHVGNVNYNQISLRQNIFFCSSIALSVSIMKNEHFPGRKVHENQMETRIECSWMYRMKYAIFI